MQSLDDTASYVPVPVELLKIRVISGGTRTAHSTHTTIPNLIQYQISKMVKYQVILVRMMSFLDEVEYDLDKQFTLAELEGLNPDKLVEWFNYVTFGDASPPGGHDMLPLIKCNTLQYWKKAISSFMPNRLAWNEISLVGNPTRSAELNDLLRRVKKIEVRQRKAAEHRRTAEILKEGRNNLNGAGAGNMGAEGFIDLPVRQQLLIIHTQLVGLTRENAELRGTIQNYQSENTIQSTRQHQILNANLNRIAMHPERRVAQRVAPNGNNRDQQQQQNDNVADGNNGGVATLSPTPKCLYSLWQEYQGGIGGRKAAKLFTPHERGQAKHKFCRRKVVWETVERLVKGGLDGNVAIDRIYLAYGREQNMTKLINLMLTDRRNNTVPSSLR
jgi:hypothetical protein